MGYNPRQVEKKWQKRWKELGLNQTEDFSKKPKFYALVEFPYPSGAGLHVGHVRSYTALDVIARKKRMEGYNVLYPMGWDAFGLPTENYAIKTKRKPQKVTKENIKVFRRQLEALGLSFDWSREINTTDPNYYKWTQWIFLRLFKNGLAYKKEISVNWCPSCKIVLANEEVIAGKCERCGAETSRKMQAQWMLAITKYADRLLADLETVDYSPRIKEQQINWIGKSEGAEIEFKIQESEFKIKVFTTRADTIFGATYLVLAPEHPIVASLLQFPISNSQSSNKKEVEKYVKATGNKSDLDRTNLTKEKTGVELKGVKAINPANGEEVPVWIADYVLPHYGTGAIMAVPAHDERDFQFAKKYNLPAPIVVCPNYPAPICPVLDAAYEGEGHLVGSDQFDGITSQEAREKIVKWLAEKGEAEKKTTYKLRDWIFSRQRYWGEPIPLVFCGECKKSKIKNQKFSEGELLNPGWIAVSENELPVKLPKVERYEPTDTGESPLAKIEKWVKTKCPKCGGEARRETDTMPNWAGSSWYFLRYCDPQNNAALADRKKLEYWMPIDLYNGGMEHATLHLLYSRFWHKFLYDIGVAPTPEPYSRRRSHGMVLAGDGQKMSKSRGNVINPDEMIKAVGADALRLYELFMGPFDQMIPWNTDGLMGTKRFLEKIWRFFQVQKSEIKNQKFSAGANKIRDSLKFKIEKLLHKTIKKVSEDIEAMKFNTAVSALMILLNEMERGNLRLTTRNLQLFIKLLAPFAPHITEEVWQGILGNKKSIHKESWPIYDPELIKEETFDLVIQVSGRHRGIVRAEKGIDQSAAEILAKKNPAALKFLNGKKIKRVIFVENRLINFVVDK